MIKHIFLCVHKRPGVSVEVSEEGKLSFYGCIYMLLTKQSTSFLESKSLKQKSSTIKSILESGTFS